MLESRTDYYQLLSEAFGSVVPGTREARKAVYNAARKGLKEQAKLAPNRFDLAAELRALEKAILDVEISAKLGEPIPRSLPGAEQKHSTQPRGPIAPPLGNRAALPGPFIPEPFNYPAPSAPQTPPVQPEVHHASPRIEWIDPQHAPVQPPANDRTPSQQPAPYYPAHIPPQPYVTPRVVVPARNNSPFQPGFLNRTDRVSYARKADPLPPPPPPPPAAKQKPQPVQPPQAKQQPAPAPEQKPAGMPAPATPVKTDVPKEVPDDLKDALPPPDALLTGSDVNILDESQSKKARKTFTPKDEPVHVKPRSGKLRVAFMIVLAACLGGAISYYAKPEQIIPKLKEYWQAAVEMVPSSKPNTGATVSFGEQREPTGQEMVELAIQQISQREYGRALAMLDEARARGARGADFYQARAYANWGAGDTELAIADYGEAIRLDPGNSSNFTNRAVAYNARGEHQLAIRDLERAIAIEPNNADNWNSRCWSKALAGQLQEAILDCNESLRLRPNDPNTLDSRGFAYLKAGQNSRAIADFDAALQIDGKIASSLYGRGLAKMRSGDRINSYTDIAEAKAVNPNIEQLFAKYGIR